MMSFNKDLSESGELVSAEGLARPDQAKVVRAGKDGAPITDGVFPGIEGISRGLLDRRRRESRASLRDRRPRIGCAGTRRRAAEYADRSAAGDERTARRLPVTSQPVGRRLRASVARTRAAGARRGRPPFPRLRRRRGCRSGGAGGGGRQWPQEGVPDNPRAWLIQVASRRMTDHLRSEVARRRRETAAAMAGRTSVAPAPRRRE